MPSNGSESNAGCVLLWNPSVEVQSRDIFDNNNNNNNSNISNRSNSDIKSIARVESYPYNCSSGENRSNLYWPSNSKVEEKVPWFLRANYGHFSRTNTTNPTLDDNDVGCAEILLSLKSMMSVRKPISSSKDLMNSNSLSPLLTLSDESEKHQFNHHRESQFQQQWNDEHYHHQQHQQQKKKIKRNINPCLEHRRKHQRCPSGCLGRKRSMEYGKQQSVFNALNMTHSPSVHKPYQHLQKQQTSDTNSMLESFDSLISPQLNPTLSGALYTTESM